MPETSKSVLEPATAKGAKAAPAVNPAPPEVRMTLALSGTALWKIQSTGP